MELIEALEFRGIEYREHSSRQNEIFINCPFCCEEGTTPDTRFRLSINVVEGKLNCFNCGKKSGTPEYSWSELQRVLETGQLEAAANLVKREAPKRIIKLPEDFRQVTYVKTSDHWNTNAGLMLKQRNVTAYQIKEKNIGYSTVGEFRYRIVIPVYYQEELVGIVARAFVRGLLPKYKNSMGQKVLYNCPRGKPKRKAVLSEGAFDALAIERVCRRYMDSMAVLGHSLTEKQLTQLLSYEEIVLWPDPDETGLEGFVKMAKQLVGVGKRVEMVVPALDGRVEYDPAELFNSEIEAKLRKVVPFSPLLEDKLRNQLAFQED